MLPEHLITGPSHYYLQGSARMHKNSMKQGGNSNQSQPSRGKKEHLQSAYYLHLSLAYTKQ